MVGAGVVKVMFESWQNRLNLPEIFLIFWKMLTWHLSKIPTVKDDFQNVYPPFLRRPGDVLLSDLKL